MQNVTQSSIKKHYQSWFKPPCPRPCSRSKYILEHCFSFGFGFFEFYWRSCLKHSFEFDDEMILRFSLLLLFLLEFWCDWSPQSNNMILYDWLYKVFCFSSCDLSRICFIDASGRLFLLQSFVWVCRRMSFLNYCIFDSNKCFNIRFLISSPFVLSSSLAFCYLYISFVDKFNSLSEFVLSVTSVTWSSFELYSIYLSRLMTMSCSNHLARHGFSLLAW